MFNGTKRLAEPGQRDHSHDPKGGWYWVALRLLIVFVVALAMSIVEAATLEGKVVGVTDGDTITVLDHENTQYQVRLGGIDAPEKRQAFGTKSKQSLAELVFDRQVSVEWRKKEQYKRLIGTIILDGQDINLLQVERGMAWHYKAYAREQPKAEREGYVAAEVLARLERRGLWRDDLPGEPWEHRKARRPQRPPIIE